MQSEGRPLVEASPYLNKIPYPNISPSRNVNPTNGLRNSAKKLCMHFSVLPLT